MLLCIHDARWLAHVKQCIQCSVCTMYDNECTQWFIRISISIFETQRKHCTWTSVYTQPARTSGNKQYKPQSFSRTDFTVGQSGFTALTLAQHRALKVTFSFRSQQCHITSVSHTTGNLSHSASWNHGTGELFEAGGTRFPVHESAYLMSCAFLKLQHHADLLMTTSV